MCLCRKQSLALECQATPKFSNPAAAERLQHGHALGGDVYWFWESCSICAPRGAACQSAPPKVRNACEVSRYETASGVQPSHNSKGEHRHTPAANPPPRQLTHQLKLLSKASRPVSHVTRATTTLLSTISQCLRILALGRSLRSLRNAGPARLASGQHMKVTAPQCNCKQMHMSVTDIWTAAFVPHGSLHCSARPGCTAQLGPAAPRRRPAARRGGWRRI